MIDTLDKGPEDLTPEKVGKYLQDVTLGYAAPDGRKFAKVVRHLLTENAELKGRADKAESRVLELEAVLSREPGDD